MDADLAFIAGLALLLYSVPAGLSAYSDGRRPRLGGLFFLMGAFLAGYGYWQSPEGYSLREIPDLALQVFARYW